MKKLLLLLLLWPMLSIGQMPTPKPGSYVHDFIGLLSENEISTINMSVHKLEIDYAIQVAIVLVKTTSGIPIEDYAREIGRTWHVGASNKRGIVYVIAMDDHVQRLEIAEGLEGDITDIRSKQITEVVRGFFRHHEYSAGLNAFVSQLNVILKPVAKLETKAVDAKENNVVLVLSFSIGAALIFILFYCLAAYRTKRKKEYEERKARVWDKINERIDNDDKIRRANYDEINALHRQIQERVNSYSDARPVRKYNVHPDRIPPHHDETRKKDDESISGFQSGVLYEAVRSSNDDNSSSSSSNSPTSDYDNYGSSDSGSSTSGFDGGGATNDI